MSKLDNWNLESTGMLVKEFQLKDFKEVLWYVNKIGEISEKMNHHPMMFISYNLLRVSLTTHEENGLSEKDFDLAEEIDKIK